MRKKERKKTENGNKTSTRAVKRRAAALLLTAALAAGLLNTGIVVSATEVQTSAAEETITVDSDETNQTFSLSTDSDETNQASSSSVDSDETDQDSSSSANSDEAEATSSSCAESDAVESSDSIGAESDGAGSSDSSDTESDAAESSDSSAAESDETESCDSTGTESEETDTDDNPYVDDELIIVYEEEALDLDDTLDLEESSDYDDLTLEEAGITEQETIVSAAEEQGEIVLAEVDTDASVEELIEELSEDPSIAWVQPNYSYELMETTTDDPYATNDTSTTKCQYYLYSSGFTEAWDTVRTEGTVTVAVLDTGCNLKHEDLTDNVNTELAYDVTTKKLLSKAGVSNNGDAQGHGTQVCGIIAATANNGTGIAGASYNASILPVRIFDDSGSCSTSDLLAGYAYLDQLVEAGTLDDLRVINLSVGYYASSKTASADQALEQVIAEMLDAHDVLTVCAAGNGASNDTCYPSDFEECLSVTSVSADGTESSFSDYNSEKDISAYGENVFTTNYLGGYSSNSGTSFCAPQVSAAVALLWALDDSLTSSEVVSILKETADPITDQNEENASAGILDVEEAVSDVASGIENPGKVTISSASVSTAGTSVTLKWKKVSDADGYQIYRSTSGGSYKKIKTITSGSTVSYTNSGLSYGTTYSYKIRAYKTAGELTLYGSYSSVKSVLTRPAKVTISSASTTTKGYVKVSWKKTTSATGYVIYRSVNGGSYKKVKTITSKSTVSWTDTSVSAGRVYRYKIKAYKTSGSSTQYSGSYSSVKKVTAKPAKTSITSSSSTKKRTATIKWTKVSGATGYQVAYRIKGTSKWYYTTVSTNKKTFTYMRNKKYYVKVRAYKTYNGTKYYAPWSSQKLMTVKQ